MYGKFFASTFTGSMFGSGPVVFAVWGYIIANTVNGTVELNPAMLAASLGASESDVQAAIDLLQSPDPKSRSKTCDGRRIIHEGGFQYEVVNHRAYRAIRHEDDRRTYNREAKRRERAKGHNVNPRQPMSTGLSAHTEAEADTEADLDLGPSVDPDNYPDRNVAHTVARATNENPTTALAPIPTNPHAKATNLINGAELRRHGQHSWCHFERGLCVPAGLHSEFMARGRKSDAEMRAWYAQTVASLGDRPVGDDLFDFWRNSFAAWVGVVSAKPKASTGKGQATVDAFAAAAARLIGGQS